MSMIVVEQKKGEHIIHNGDKVTEIMIVLKGSVIMKSEGNEMLLESGSVIGLMECAYGKFFCDYVAKEDTLLVTYAYEKREDLEQIFEEQPQYVYAFLHAELVLSQRLIEKYVKEMDRCRELYLFLVKGYREYQFLSKKYSFEPLALSAQNVEPIDVPIVIKSWEIEYVEALMNQSQKTMTQFYGTNIMLSIGEIFKLSQLMGSLVRNLITIDEYGKQTALTIINSDEEDLLSLWFDLANKCAKKREELDQVNSKIKQFQEYLSDNKMLTKQYKDRFDKFWNQKNSNKSSDDAKEKPEAKVAGLAGDMDYFEFIINYAGYDEERKKEILNKRDNNQSLTEVFYEVYEKSFFKSLEEETLSPMLSLFFNFGFMDPGLVEEETLIALLALSEKIEETSAKTEEKNKKEPCCHVYTMYNWLKAIYEGKKETSKNEFDLDYVASLRELRKANKITAEDEKLFKEDRVRMVKYEIENMFHSGNKGTYGRCEVYSPILNQDDIVKNPEEMWISPARLERAIENVRAIDFGVFYRDILFYDSERESSRMNLMKEIVPDIILMPNAGKQGMMWQESVGTGRDTPGRFLYPMLSIMDLDNSMTETLGRYRWEICRKLQGMRWNDVSEPSLTSSYYDYLSFYKRNKNLSPETREKIKNSLTHVKGSFREMFVLDYVNWIRYESKGNFRVNKIARELLSLYCPFELDIRMHLMENPMFRTYFARYDAKMLKESQHFKKILRKYKESGGELIQEMVDTLHFYGK